MKATTPKTTFIRARVDPRVKRDAEKVLRTLGVNTSSAVTMFLKQVSLRQGLPFEVHIPNAVTVRALTAKLDPKDAYSSADALMADILK